MGTAKGSWGKILLGCGVVALLVLVAASGIVVLLMLRPASTISTKGGTEIVLQVDLDHAVEQRPEQPAEEVRSVVMDQTLETIRRRADESGVDSPSVMPQGEDRIVVQLPGVTDADALVGLWTQVANLEFRLVDSSLMPAELEREVQQAMTDAGLDENAVDDQIAAAAVDLTPDGFELLWEEERDPGTGQRVRVRPYLVHHQSVLTGENVADASVNHDQFVMPYVALEFDEAGKQRFCQATRAHTQEKLAIVLDDAVLSVPIIVEPICGGEAQITMGTGSPDVLQRQAADLAVNLRAGALPAPVTVESVTVVGPAE